MKDFSSFKGRIFLLLLAANLASSFGFVYTTTVMAKHHTTVKTLCSEGSAKVNFPNSPFSHLPFLVESPWHPWLTEIHCWCSNHPNEVLAWPAASQSAPRLIIILHFFNPLSLKWFSCFFSLSYLFCKLSTDTLFRSQHNGVPSSLTNTGVFPFLITVLSTVIDPFIPLSYPTVTHRLYFWRHFTSHRWLNGFNHHHPGSQKNCYHTRTKFSRNRKAAQEPSSSSQFSKANRVADKGIHRFPLRWARINEDVSHLSFAEF